jgi:hypothetical protein
MWKNMKNMTLEKAFLESLTPEQRQLRKKIAKLSKERRDRDDEWWERMLGSVIQTALTVPIPRRLTEREEVAVLHVLRAASTLFHYGIEKSGWFRDPISFTRSKDDKKYQLLITAETSGHPKNLAEITDKTIRPMLNDPGNWEKIKVRNSTANPKGEGYRIEVEAFKEGVAFNVAHLLSSDPKYRKDSHVYFSIGGEQIDFSQLCERMKNLQPKDIDPYTQHPRSYVVLTGEAAKEIIGGKFGVDMSRIREASQRQL